MKKTYEQLVDNYRSHNADYYMTPSLKHMEPFKLFGPIYYVGDQMVCVHLIDTEDGLLLLDCGYPQAIHMLTDSIYQLGYDPRQIKEIIMTHGHYDHFGAAMEFKRLYGCKLAMSKVDANLLREKPELGLASWTSFEHLITLPEIDHEIENGEHIRLGCIDMECKLIPGHTPGAMAFFFNVTEDGSHYYRAGEFGGAGKGSATRCTLEHFGMPLSQQRDMLKSIENMKKEHVDIQLGNHPANNHTLEKRREQLAGNPMAFLDPESWSGFLAETERSFTQLIAEDNNE
ncbi:MAG: MBL fold metallo-hydrolase [Lachnospiraceae bacterium]|nr:MBL fold metallo-hydrolase [Lachnospiraceae bacterium]